MTLNGDIEFAEEIEQEDGSLIEFVYKGEFRIVGSTMELELEGEYDDENAGPVVLVLNK
jgi:hypothetical protein